MTTALLAARDLTKTFDIRKGLSERLLVRDGYLVRAVDGVSFEVARGETLGLIGESGCGKSTLARVVLRLQEPTSGEIQFDGREIGRASPQEMRALRKRMQIVFQDPFASLNPRRTVGQIIELPLTIHEPRIPRGERRDRAAQILERVGLPASHLDRYPHQFSGGQRQRINIARALIARPDLVVCDEAVSALDASVQAQILNLLGELKAELGLTYLFISHNLAVVGSVSDRIAVMYLGRIVEIGPARAIAANPSHPYTQLLFKALPRLDGRKPQRLAASGDPPSPIRIPSGCRFHTRCPVAVSRCREADPQLEATPDGRLVACHLAEKAHTGGRP
jgi:oligopeptide/dipeptide ABC transporter ATP-binding protein